MLEGEMHLAMSENLFVHVFTSNKDSSGSRFKRRIGRLRLVCQNFVSAKVIAVGNGIVFVGNFEYRRRGMSVAKRPTI